MHCKRSANPIVRGVLRVEKKKINWLGWLSVLVLVPPEVYFICLSIITKDDDLVGVAVIGFIVVVVLISIFWKWGWRLVLPNKRAWAKLICKRVGVPSGSVEGMPDTVLHFFLTFEFLDGSRVSYSTPMSLYKRFSEGETGILTYKEQGGVGFFVSFERQG